MNLLCNFLISQVLDKIQDRVFEVFPHLFLPDLNDWFPQITRPGIPKLIYFLDLYSKLSHRILQMPGTFRASYK